MSFLIAVHVNEGIVLASDRRTTYTNTQQLGDTVVQRIGIDTTNSTDKTFVCPQRSRNIHLWRCLSPWKAYYRLYSRDDTFKNRRILSCREHPANNS